MRLFLHRLRNDRSLRLVVVPIVGIVVASLVAAAVVDTRLARAGSAVDRAERLAAKGDYVGAERLYWEALRSGPVDLPTAIALIDGLGNTEALIVSQADSRSSWRSSGFPALLQPAP